MGWALPERPPIHSMLFHPVSLKCILILSSRYVFLFFLLAFSPITYIYSSSPHSCYMPCLSLLPWLEHSTNNYTWRRSSSLCNFLHPHRMCIGLRNWKNGPRYNQRAIGLLVIKTPWPESGSELYRPSDRRLSAKLVPTFADIECHVVSVTDPYGHILGFLDRRRYLFLQVAPQSYSWSWVDPVPNPLLFRKSGSAGNRIRTSGSIARNSGH
jgi:hypothetical protein